MRLLRQCLQEAGVDGEVALPSKPAKEAPSMQQFPSLAAALGSAPGSAGSAHAAAPGHGERGQFTVLFDTHGKRSEWGECLVPGHHVTASLGCVLPQTPQTYPC